MERKYPKNDKIGVLEMLETKTFFAAQPWWTHLLRIFVKFSPRALHWCISVRLSKKSKIFLIYLSTITWIPEISEGK